MTKIAGSLLAGIALAAAGPTAAKNKPEMTPMEIQALQSHEYETTKEVLFASVVSVFQDLGYQLENADMPSGFVTASSATRNKTNFLEAVSGQRSSGNTRVTAFVETMPGGMARVRLNFLNTRSSSTAYGRQSKEDKPVLDAQTYRVAWDKIDQAVFVRGASRPATKPAPTITVPVTPSTAVSEDKHQAGK